jgi:hypothetical protein
MINNPHPAVVDILKIVFRLHLSVGYLENETNVPKPSDQQSKEISK